jgi:hypothetical protein
MNLAEAKTEYLNGDYKLKNQFELLNGERSALLARCEKYAGWTLPSVFPRTTHDDNDELQYDFQSVGARAVTHLGNKIMMSLFQPSKPFFRMNLSDEQIASIKDATGADKPEIEKMVAAAERAAGEKLNKKNGRVALTEAVILLIITGNVLLSIPKQEKIGVYNLRDYVITRDLRGDVTELIIKETKKVRGLSDELAALCGSNGKDPSSEVSLYTCARRVGPDKFLIWQELENFAYAHKSPSFVNAADLPWIPLTWSLSRGADYGNGLVENYAGEFHTLSTLAETILDFTAAATDIKNLVHPAGMTDVDEIAQAATGSYVTGREEDIFSYSPDVKMQADFLINRFDAAERRIGGAFLMNSMVTRDAERVTAEEIRVQAQELESSLGGVYSRLAVDGQQPLARYLMSEDDELFKSIEPEIVTGLESLSRMSDVDRLRAMLLDAALLADVPEKVAVRLLFGGILARLSAGHGVDTEGILATEEQATAIEQANAKTAAAAAGQEAGAVAQAEGQEQ